jgi:hypothetical protein
LAAIPTDLFAHGCVGFGLANGPGTGGIDCYGNHFDRQGQFLPGGQVTVAMALDIMGFVNPNVTTFSLNSPPFVL